VFQNINEMFIMVPPLLGLKGNLEMSLAARLSTQANLGNMATTSQKFNIAVSNLALIQVQGLVVGFLTAIGAAAFEAIFSPDMLHITDAAVLIASALVTAAIATFVLGLVTILVIIISNKIGINPDNVATPIAAALGDVTTLALLGITGDYLYKQRLVAVLSPTIIVTCLASVPVFIMIARKSPLTSGILRTGWLPVISAMVISR
jgi:solute carrier family 41